MFNARTRVLTLPLEVLDGEVSIPLRSIAEQGRRGRQRGQPKGRETSMPLCGAQSKVLLYRNYKT